MAIMTTQNDISALTENDGLIKIIECINPFDQSTYQCHFVEYDKTKSIADYLAETEGWAVSLSGGIVQTEHLTSTFPAQDDVIVIAPLIEGGDSSSKNILRIVAFIALAVVTYGASTGYFAAAGGAFAAGTTSAAALATGIQIVGSVLINSLLPAQVAGAENNNNLDDSPTYGIDGPVNVSSEGIPVPVCFGEHRMAGNIINFYTENVGKNQVLYMLFNAGEGPIAAVSDIQINDQPVSAYDEVVIELRDGDNEQDVIPWFASTISAVDAGNQILPAWTDEADLTGIPNFVTQNVVDRIRFDLIAQNGFLVVDDEGRIKPHERPIVLGYRQVANPAGDPLAGVGQPHEPMQFEVGNIRASEVDFKYRYRRLYSSLGPDGELDPSQEWEETNVLRPGTYEDASGEQIVIREQQGASPDPTTDPIVGWRAWETESDAVAYGDPVFRGRSRSPLRQSWYSPPITQGYYQLFAGTLEEHQGGESTVDELRWTAYAEVVLDEVAYQNTALVGLKMRLNDQLTGKPNVTYINHGVLCRQWNGSQWVYEPSSNPAWCAMEALLNKRWGLGVSWSEIDRDAFIEWASYCDTQDNPLRFDAVIDQQMDSWTFLNYIFRAGHAQITRVGTRFSVVVEASSDPVMMFSEANIVKDSFSCTWLTLDDRANSVEIKYFDKDAEYRQRTVRVVDPDIAPNSEEKPASLTLIGITQRERIIEEANFHLNLNRLVTKTISFEAALDAIACAPGSVIFFKRMGESTQKAGRLKYFVGNTLTLDQNIEMSGGDSYWIKLHFPSLVHSSQNIVSVNQVAGYLEFDASAVDVLDEPSAPLQSANLIVVGGNEFNVAAVTQDGSSIRFYPHESINAISQGQSAQIITTDALLTMALANQGIETSDLNFQDATFFDGKSCEPSELQHFIITKNEELESEKYRVISIASGGNQYTRKITAIEYNEAVYDFDGGIIPGDTETNQPDEKPIGQVEDLAVSEEAVYQQDSLKFFLQLNWLRPANGVYEGAEVYSRIEPSDEWEQIATVSAGSTVHRFEAVQGDTLELKVVARDNKGNRAPFTTAPTVTITVGDANDSTLALTQFTASNMFQRITAEWRVNDQAKYSRAELRYTFDAGGSPGSDPEVGATIVPEILDFSHTIEDVQQGAYRIWVRAFDKNEEATPWFPAGGFLVTEAIATMDNLWTALNFVVTGSHLEEYLNTRIDRIDSLVDIDQFQDEVDATLENFWLATENNSLIVDENRIEETAAGVLVSQIDGIGARLNAAEAAIIDERYARVTATGAIAGTQTTLHAQFEDNRVDFQSSIDILATANNARYSEIQTVTATANNAEGSAAAVATRATTLESEVGIDINGAYTGSGLAHTVQQIGVTIDGDPNDPESGGISGQITSLSDVQAEFGGLTGDSALVTSVKQHTIDIQGDPNDPEDNGLVGLIEEKVSQEYVDGHLTQMWAVNMEVEQNGQLWAAGFGLGLEPDSGGGYISQFRVLANSFVVGEQGYETPIFSVITSSQVTPYGTLPAGVYVNGDLNVNGSILQAESVSSGTIAPGATHDSELLTVPDENAVSNTTGAELGSSVYVNVKPGETITAMMFVNIVVTGLSNIVDPSQGGVNYSGTTKMDWSVGAIHSPGVPNVFANSENVFGQLVAVKNEAFFPGVEYSGKTLQTLQLVGRYTNSSNANENVLAGAAVIHTAATKYAINEEMVNDPEEPISVFVLSDIDADYTAEVLILRNKR